MPNHEQTNEENVERAVALWKAGHSRAECLDAMPRAGPGHVYPPTNYDRKLRAVWNMLLTARDGDDVIIPAVDGGPGLNATEAAAALSWTMDSEAAAMMLVLDETLLVLLSYDVGETGIDTLVLSCDRDAVEQAALDIADDPDPTEGGRYLPLEFPKAAWSISAGTGNPNLLMGQYLCSFEEGDVLGPHSWSELVAASPILSDGEYNPLDGGICLDPRWKKQVPKWPKCAWELWRDSEAGKEAERAFKANPSNASRWWRAYFAFKDLPADERAPYDKLAEEAKAAPPEYRDIWETHTGIDTMGSATHLLLASQVEERGPMTAQTLTDKEAEASSCYVDLMLALYTAFDIEKLPPPGELRRRRWRPHILLRALCERGRATIGSSKRGSTRRSLADAKLVFVYESCPADVFKHIVECL